MPSTNKKNQKNKTILFINRIGVCYIITYIIVIMSNTETIDKDSLFHTYNLTGE